MSLTSFIKIGEVRGRFSREFPMPPFNLQAEMVAPPITRNYGLVGTAFDYLMRFYLEHLNPSAITSQWVAELALEHELVKTNLSLFKRAKDIIIRAKEVHSSYIKSGKFNDELIKSSIHLAQLDPIFRAGAVDPNTGVAEAGDVMDLKNLITNVKPDVFKAKKLCVLNPSFGEGSNLVGGADTDLLIDNVMIDIKTTKNLRLERDHVNQLIGYYILFTIGGIDNLEARPKIDTLGIYYSRYGVLYTIPVEFFTNMPNFSGFVKWFKKTAEETFIDIEAF